MSAKKVLSAFAKEAGFRGPGALSVALVLTQKAREKLPLDADALLTAGGGQVAGLGKGAVQAVLAKHGIKRVLAQEGGRTSRGSVAKMRAYVGFLNSLKAPVDCDAIEAFWIARVVEYFAAKPFKFKTDASLSIRASVRELLSQAQARQKDFPGSRYEGTMLQHLIGAKLEIIMGQGKIEHHSASEADVAEGRPGDFLLGDVAIHVTTHPSEGLIAKCKTNLEASLRPLIITTGKSCVVAEGIAEQAGIANRIDVLDAEQFLATNIHEWGRFNAAQRTIATGELLARYNELIETHETDPSLKVEIQ